MSRPRIRKEQRKQLITSPTKEADYSFVPVPSPKRQSTRKALPIVFADNGQKFTQHSRLPLPLGQIGLRDRPRGLTVPTHAPTFKPTQSTDIENENPFILPPQSLPSRHQLKKINQMNTWTTEVIPKLVHPYLRLLRETQNLQQEGVPAISECICLGSVHSLSVLVVRFDSRGYQMKGEESLRRRFGNALQWFNSLQHATTQPVDSLIMAHCDSLDTTDGGSSDTIEDASEEGYESPKRQRFHEEPPSLSRPSEYLRSRCPICFGGNSRISEGLDSIVCIDACFTQKHTKQHYWDPQRTHPNTVFIAEEDVEAWENFVAEVHPSRPMKDFEDRLKVPGNVLDDCEKSFTAADGTREKASTQFFNSTALMGLLCRHDHVLWLVNMTSPGERQHYTFSLIDTLFKHLPPMWTVGLLYDVACTLKRSSLKWGFLDQYIDRITFAISVFHAYGHGWACQCVYHPRKCKGFGLSDGEGCERFWHSISKLIAYLRVCGHHTRLYTLDSQIHQSDHESLQGFGKWIAQKWQNAEARRIEGNKDVVESQESPEFLQHQWEEQVASQTKPLPRQSQTAGKKAVEEAVRLQKVRDSLVTRISRFEDIICDVDADGVDYIDAEEHLPILCKQLETCQNKLSQSKRALGVNDHASFQHLTKSKYINYRMNARALKMRLRMRLRARKFERNCIERSARRQQYNECKIQDQTEDSVKRRDPGIQKLARSYNKHAPRNAVAPLPITLKGLFNLDVDDNIWEDIGLNDDDDEGPPPWLSSERVRKDGVKASGDLSIHYQLLERKDALLRLCITWSQSLSAVSFFSNGTLPPWGPSDKELESAAAGMASEIVVEVEGNIGNEVGGDYISSDEEESQLDEEEFDVGLLEQMDTLQVGDEEDI
ncbi:hypothetical protein DFH05DRAFT_1520046 [Lentinula detonsa]|uniref:CxC1-like cysteine cluster associated with KDZ transposases domain-containing protein n=1 Tax=Lentinula detonsa TaxID=2804962 RepID=A0A9W8P783_9AGAR|nr:hypothetical protein DFH05DRAFT_1520046 [Lentinula detonsa]